MNKKEIEKLYNLEINKEFPNKIRLTKLRLLLWDYPLLGL